MKIGKLVSHCLLALLLCAAARAQTDPNAQLLQDLLKVNEAYIVAAKTHDLPALQALTSRDYVATDPYFPYMLVGDDVLQDVMTGWDYYYKPVSGDEVLARTPAQASVRRFGEVAILSYVELDIVKARGGDRMRGGRAGKCTFVYHLQNGKWILVNSQITDASWPGAVLLGNGQ